MGISSPGHAASNLTRRRWGGGGVQNIMYDGTHIYILYIYRRDEGGGGGGGGCYDATWFLVEPSSAARVVAYGPGQLVSITIILKRITSIHPPSHPPLDRNN